MDNNSKIQLLRTDILDKGYDPNQFESFCETHLARQVDLDEISYQQLQQLILQFVKENSASNSTNDFQFNFDQ